MTIQTLNTITDSDKQLLIKGNFAIDTMLLISDTFKNPNTMIKNTTQPLLLRYYMMHDGNYNLDDYLVLTIDDAIKTWDEVEDRYKEDEGFIGQFIARTLTGELQNISDDFNIENKFVTLLMGITQRGGSFISSEDEEILVTEDYENVSVGTSNNATTWYSLGTFQVQRPENDDVKDNTKYECFDLSTLFNKNFDPLYTDDMFETSFKTTLDNGGSFTALDLAVYTCNQVGVGFYRQDAMFSNYDFEINSNQFTEGNSCRDVMKALAKLGFGWCEIGWNDGCTIVNTVTNKENIENTDKLTNDNYYSLTTQKNVYGEVNSVYVGMTGVEGEGVEETKPSPLPEGTKKVQIRVMDNPLTYTLELRQRAVNNANLLSNLLGLSYTPIEMETPGHIWWKGNTPIEIKQMDNSLIYTYPFNRTITYNGNIKTKITSYAKTESETENGYDKDFYTELQDTRIIVDKQEGKITQQALQINNQGEIIQGVQATLNKQEARINIISTNINEENGDVTAVRTENGFTFNKDGLNIYVGENQYNTQINNVGTYYRDGNNDIVKTTKDGSVLVNVSEQGLHKYSYDGYGEYGFVDERIEVDGEYCYATFYNREV